jgi:hypothetical protein
MVNATTVGVLFAGIFPWRRNLAANTGAHVLYELLVLLT